LIQKHDVFLTPITEFELFLGAKTSRHNDDLKMLFNEIQTTGKFDIKWFS
jgi:hypothetical protein